MLAGVSDRERKLIEVCPGLVLTTAAAAYPVADANPGSELQLLQIENAICTAMLSLQGAQVLSYTPQGQSDLLWLSPAAALSQGAAIRGGIPICLPWFGVNQQDLQKPKHGFARLTRWSLERATVDGGGVTHIVLAMDQFRDTPHELFPYPFVARLRLAFGSSLQLELQVQSHADTSMPLSWALHSYHPVKDLATVTISGLAGCEYLDNTEALSRFRQEGDPRFQGEFDRVYLDVGREQIIVTEPALSISAQHAPSAIVWNPGEKLAAAMPDLGIGRHREFICLERGAAFDNALQLEPGESMNAVVTIAMAKAG